MLHHLVIEDEQHHIYHHIYISTGYFKVKSHAKVHA